MAVPLFSTLSIFLPASPDSPAIVQRTLSIKRGQWKESVLVSAGPDASVNLQIKLPYLCAYIPGLRSVQQSFSINILRITRDYKTPDLIKAPRLTFQRAVLRSLGASTDKNCEYLALSGEQHSRCERFSLSFSFVSLFLSLCAITTDMHFAITTATRNRHPPAVYVILFREFLRHPLLEHTLGVRNSIGTAKRRNN